MLSVKIYEGYLFSIHYFLYQSNIAIFKKSHQVHLNCGWSKILVLSVKGKTILTTISLHEKLLAVYITVQMNPNWTRLVVFICNTTVIIVLYPSRCDNQHTRWAINHNIRNTIPGALPWPRDGKNAFSLYVDVSVIIFGHNSFSSYRFLSTSLCLSASRALPADRKKHLNVQTQQPQQWPRQEWCSWK